MVQQWQYDEYDEVVVKITLMSLEEPSSPPPFLGGDVDPALLIVGGGSVGIAVVAIIIARTRSGREPTTDYYSGSESGYHDY